MKKEMRKFIQREFPQKAERIIRYSLSEHKIEEAGIKLKKHEVFVRYPEFPDYYGSNYGRLISLKSGIPTLLNENIDNKGYVVYTLSKPPIKRWGKKVVDSTSFPITAHRMVADLFLPNYWQEMDRAKLETHHLSHNKRDNKWTNLILVPSKLHFWLNRVEKIWFFSGKAFRKRTPYQIQRQTDMSLEDIILPLKRDPDMITTQDDHPIRVYDLGGYFVGYQLTEAALRKLEERKSKK